MDRDDWMTDWWGKGARLETWHPQNMQGRPQGTASLAVKRLEVAFRRVIGGNHAQTDDLGEVPVAQ
jgi:hypothetical protein